MGFSFIAAFEVIYSFTLRIFFRKYIAARDGRDLGDDAEGNDTYSYFLDAQNKLTGHNWNTNLLI